MEEDREELHLTDEDCHIIDELLYLEGQAVLAFASLKLCPEEFELHRDDHLRQIAELFNSKLPIAKKAGYLSSEEVERGVEAKNKSIQGQLTDAKEFIELIQTDFKAKIEQELREKITKLLDSGVSIGEMRDQILTLIKSACYLKARGELPQYRNEKYMLLSEAVKATWDNKVELIKAAQQDMLTPDPEGRVWASVYKTWE